MRVRGELKIKLKKKSDEMSQRDAVIHLVAGGLVYYYYFIIF